jgi:hypothetical protein
MYKALMGALFFVALTAQAEVIKLRDSIAMKTGSEMLYCQPVWEKNNNRWVTLSFVEDVRHIELREPSPPSRIRVSGERNQWSAIEKGKKEEVKLIRSQATNDFVRKCGELLVFEGFKKRPIDANFLQGFDWGRTKILSSDGTVVIPQPRKSKTASSSPVVKPQPLLKNKKKDKAEIKKSPHIKKPVKTQVKAAHKHVSKPAPRKS